VSRVAPHRLTVGSRMIMNETSLYDDLIAAGRNPRTVVRQYEILPATDLIATALTLPGAAQVTWFERLRYADQEPVAMMQNAVPVSILRPQREAMPRS
jgi:DNA-binding GntR family transcriptional regulator